MITYRIGDVVKGGWDEKENHWRHRLIDPDEFDDKTFRTKQLTDGVEAVFGKKTKDGPMEAQTLLFAKPKFDKKKAQTWLKEHWAEHEKALSGGESEKERFTEADADPEELKVGIEIEREHTDDPKEAKQIALDHLSEDKNYYTKLAKVEKSVRIVIWA